MARRLEYVETRTKNIEELVQTANYRTNETITNILEWMTKHNELIIEI